MDIDYAIRKDEPHKFIDISTPDEILLYKRWEKSNRLSVMYIKTKISAGIRGSIKQHENVRELLKAIDACKFYLNCINTLKLYHIVLMSSETI